MLGTLQRGWNKNLGDLFRKAERELTISSPYFTDAGAKFLIEAASGALKSGGSLRFVTDLSPMNICQGSTDPSAFKTLFDSFAGIQLLHLPRLHAKVYISDECRAIVTSGNLTAGGLFNNFEYGVMVESKDNVRTIKQDLVRYGGLGASLTAVEITAYSKVSDEVKRLYRRMAAAPKRQIDQLLHEAVAEAQDELIRIRLGAGALHTIFEKTIRYLLEKYGPLPTATLHLYIEEIHPDLCDNSIDRVINGKRFGKKWKHAARTAQQHLRRRDTVELVDGKWKLT